jgi:hypothetical protein
MRWNDKRAGPYRIAGGSPLLAQAGVSGAMVVSWEPFESWLKRSLCLSALMLEGTSSDHEMGSHEP